jgi:VCBS repeat-containing protein
LAGAAGNGGGAAGGGGSGGGANATPIILTASANQSVLPSGSALTLSVVATDPDGVADLLGGVIQTPAGATYGSLVASATGTYQVTLPWNAIHATAAVELAPGGQESRTFVVVVYDQTGATATSNVIVSLTSSVPGYAVCNGVAVDPMGTANCGACGFSCASTFGGTFGGLGECVDDGGVFCHKQPKIVLSASDGTTTCEQKCEQAAGSQVFSWYVPSCQVVNAGANCQLGFCPTATYAALPASCKSANTFVECTCDVWWESPGF